jgi:hypothetical protein
MAQPDLLLTRWSNATVNSWGELILGVGASIVVLTLLVFYTGMTGAQRTQILSRVRRIVALPG